MKNTGSLRLSVFALLLFAGAVFFLLQPRSFAAETAPARFICAARVDCGGTTLPSTQDLPTERIPTVISKTAAAAREKCASSHSGAYLRLAKSVDDVTPAALLKNAPGCKVVSEAFRE